MKKLELKGLCRSFMSAVSGKFELLSSDLLLGTLQLVLNGLLKLYRPFYYF